MEWYGARAVFLDSKMVLRWYSSQILVYLSEKSNFRYFRVILVDFSTISTKSLQNPTRSFLEIDPGKYRVFFLPAKFWTFSTEQKCVGNNRNKTSRLSTLFCTINYQKPFTSLFENELIEDAMLVRKRFQKLKTRSLVMYEYTHA